MVRALARLAVGLQAVVELVQQLADKRAADLVAHVAQALAELAQALACPQQRRLRIAPRLRLDQSTQIVEQARIGLAHGLAPAARAANSSHIGRLAGAQFPQATTDRAARNSCRAIDRPDPAKARRHSLGCRKAPPSAFVEHRRQRLIALSYRRLVNHDTTIDSLSNSRNPIIFQFLAPPDSIISGRVLSPCRQSMFLICTLHKTAEQAA